MERAKIRVKGGNTVFEVSRDLCYQGCGEGSGLTGEDSSHGRILGDEII